MIDQTLHGRVLARFARSVVLAHKRYHARNEVKKDLDAYVDKISTLAKKNKKTDMDEHMQNLNRLVHQLIARERELIGYDAESGQRIAELESKIDGLESQLKQERNKNKEIEAKYKDKISDMKKTFAYLKSKLIEFIAEKRDRNKKLDSIHQKIERHIAQNSYSTNPLPSTSSDRLPLPERTQLPE